MLGLNSTGTGTCPADTTGIIYGCEGNLLIENNSVGVIAILYLNDVIIDGNMFGVITYDVVLIGHAGFGIVGRPSAMIREVLSDTGFSAGRERKPFRNLRPYCVVLVCGNRD